MPDFEKAILHILDCEHNTCIISDECMNESEELNTMLQTKANKVFASAQKKKGSFKEGSICKEWIERYQDGQFSFEELSEKFARCIFDSKMKYGLYASSDLLIAIVMNEGRRYLLGIDNAYHEGITHEIRQGETTKNEICLSSSLLSSNLVKDDRVFLIELSDFSVSCIETKVVIEAEKVNFFADRILFSTTEPSYKEAVTSIAKTVERMADKYDIDEMEIMPKMKSIIKENVETQTPIRIEEVADQLFADKPLAKGDFKEEMRTQGIHKDVEVEYVKPAKAETVQKIRTDKGIELIIPVDYMNSRDFVEFKNQPDGTISIQLKNITHITSK